MFGRRAGTSVHPSGRALRRSVVAGAVDDDGVEVAAEHDLDLCVGGGVRCDAAVALGGEPQAVAVGVEREREHVDAAGDVVAGR